MRRHRPLSWPMLCGALLYGVIAQVAAQTTSADTSAVLSVTSVSGSSEVERLGERHLLSVGETIAERDVLRLAGDGHLSLRLAQGGLLELGPGAELSVEKLPNGNTTSGRKSIFSLAHGYLRIAWAPQPDLATPFYLYFSGQRASLDTGEYFFQSESDSARVCVASGKLTATPIASSNSHLLAASACYGLSADEQPERIARDANAWAAMRRNFSLNAPNSPEAELAANDPSAHAGSNLPTVTAPVIVEAPAAPRPRAVAPVVPIVEPARAAPTAASASRPLAAVPPAAARPAASPAIPPATPPAATIAAKPVVNDGGWAINVGSFADRAAADRQVQQLQVSGAKPSVQSVQIGGRPWFRVQLRGFASRDAAQAQAQILKTKGNYANLWVVHAP